MHTAHSRISVEMEMKERVCVNNADTALCAREEEEGEGGREGGGAVDAAPACTCRCVLRMRMETEVRRRVWTYALPIALAVLAVVERGWFWLQLLTTALLHAYPRIGVQCNGRRGRYLYARMERGQPFSLLTRSPSSWSMVYGCRETHTPMHTGI
jgi:hypothetical protein